MAEATKALNKKLEVHQGAEFNPECSGNDKTMAVTASIEAAAMALMEQEHGTPRKGWVRNSRVPIVPEFEINLKKVGGSDGRNVVKKTTKMRKSVRIA